MKRNRRRFYLPAAMILLGVVVYGSIFLLSGSPSDPPPTTSVNSILSQYWAFNLQTPEYVLTGKILPEFANFHSRRLAIRASYMRTKGHISQEDFLKKIELHKTEIPNYYQGCLLPTESDGNCAENIYVRTIPSVSVSISIRMETGYMHLASSNGGLVTTVVDNDTVYYRPDVVYTDDDDDDDDDTDADDY
jgi:hypothetical protein